jgi:hypothetical protein
MSKKFNYLKNPKIQYFHVQYFAFMFLLLPNKIDYPKAQLVIFHHLVWGQFGMYFEWQGMNKGESVTITLQ